MILISYSSENICKKAEKYILVTGDSLQTKSEMKMSVTQAVFGRKPLKEKGCIIKVVAYAG